ncbi:MAG: Crp/Fnr family transcriptional regulator [Treponema sp.]|nr:Crp/Fnr family transcriptional regulator [Treponema sp.]
MDNFSAILSRCPLFEGLSGGAIAKVLGCIKPGQRSCANDAPVFREDSGPAHIGIVLSGALHLVRNDRWGNRAIVARFEPGMVFGEAFVCAGVKALPVSIIAAERSEILLFNFTRIISVCSAACEFHTGLIKNMIANLAQKNIQLMEKIECVTQRNTRSKILSYLSLAEKRRKGPVIEIPFDRQELADYLSVDRSALSAELCRMRDEGLLAFHKNKFQIL